MEEALLDLDTNGHERHLAVYDAAFEDLPIARNPRLPVDAQGLFAAGHEEDQADVRVRQQIEHAVQPLVAWTFRDDESPVIEDLDKAGCVALGRHVASSAAASEVASRRNGERAMNARLCSSSDRRSF